MASRILAGRYELQDKIGEGGMAVVFRSRDRLLNRNVAIKILRPEFTKDSVFIESFRRESQMAAGLTHPNIVNIYDVGKESNIYYIVMELMNGKALSEIIKEEGALDPRRATNITKQIASALSAAHRNHLIHRDVKPHNIMFGLDGTAKITDFGIAKKVTGETLIGDHKENVMGSVHYFSPEQAKGGNVDERSDIYSLGICLYEMLTGRVPFDGETAVEVAVKHINEAMVPPTSINPDIPRDLEEIIMKATDKDPANRYQNADEMIHALSFVSFNVAHHTEEASAPEKPAESARLEKTAYFGDDYLISSESMASAEDNKRNDAEAPRNKKHSLNDRDAGRREADRKEAGQAGEKKRFFLAPQRYIAVILAIALAIPVSAKIFNFVNREESTGEEKKSSKIVEVTVPNIVGQSLEDAEKILKAEGLLLEVDLELVSKEIPSGQVMSQTPSADSVVKSNQTVRVNVSKGTVSGTVPNITGKSTKSAQTVLDSYNYRMIVSSYREDSRIDEGYIISQNPAAGTELADGGSVYIVVSSGAPKAVSFDIVGMSYADARTVIQDAGYSMGIVTNQPSEEVEFGNVIKYSVNGNTVDLYISSGIVGDAENEEAAEEISVDGYIDYYLDYSAYQDKLAEYTVSAFSVSITIIDDAGTRTVFMDCPVENEGYYLHIEGAGTDGALTIMNADLGITVQHYHVNFEEHTY